MAEAATIARPYAQALLKACDQSQTACDKSRVAVHLNAVALVANNPQLQQFASNPQTSIQQVLELMAAVLKEPLLPQVDQLLKVVLENHRLVALPEIAAQFQRLVDAVNGVAHAVVYSPRNCLKFQPGLKNVLGARSKFTLK
jgi:F-type H+-transporting ATPase subunit delta